MCTSSSASVAFEWLMSASECKRTGQEQVPMLQSERRTYRKSPGRQYAYDYDPLRSRSHTPADDEERRGFPAYFWYSGSPPRSAAHATTAATEHPCHEGARHDGAGAGGDGGRSRRDAAPLRFSAASRPAPACATAEPGTG